MYGPAERRGRAVKYLYSAASAIRIAEVLAPRQKLLRWNFSLGEWMLSVDNP